MDTQDRFGFSRRVFLRGVIPFVLGCGIFLQACDHREEREGNKMAVSTNMSSIRNGVIAPIDRSASSNIETATFALG
jgi:hypothetical protein